MKYHDFLDDEEKMVDFLLLNKDEFLRSYSYMTEEEWDMTYDRVLDLVKFTVAFERVGFKTVKANEYMGLVTFEV